MPFNKEEIITYTFNSNHVISLYRSAIGVGFWPDFPDYQIESLSWFLDAAKLNELSEIDTLIKDNKEIITRYIAHIYAGSSKPWRVTPGFLCKLVLIAKYPDAFSVEKLIEHGWDIDIAESILLSANKFAPYIA